MNFFDCEFSKEKLKIIDAIVRRGENSRELVNEIVNGMKY